jgi:hypothetical protein
VVKQHSKAAGIRITIPAALSPHSVTTQWIGGGIAPHHRATSRAGIHGDRSWRHFLTVAQVLPFDLPLHGVSVGVGVGAFLVTGALAGREAVVDLARRSLRWRVPVRWYLTALFTVPVGATLISLAVYGSPALASPADSWPRALAEVAAAFVLQLVLFQFAEEIGFTGFLQHHWQDRYHPMKLTLVRGPAVGGVAPARPFRRRRLGSGGADGGSDRLRYRVRPKSHQRSCVLKSSHADVV